GDSGIQRLRSIRTSPVGRLISHSMRQPNRSGAAMVEAIQLVMMYAPATSPPIRTISHPRWRAGMVSDIRAKAIGSMPPTPRPMMKQTTRFAGYQGIAPHTATATKMMAARRIDARRPILSPNQPHRNDPHTVPAIPERGYRAMGRAWAVGFSGDFRPYSLAAPGAMNARVVGFITSMVMA